MMHIHTHYSGPSASDYLDTDSCLAIELRFIIFLHTLFKLPMTMVFNFVDTLLADFVLMDTSEFLCVFYPPTCTLVDTHLDITPAMDIDVQLVACLLSLMTDSCPEKLFHHLCCDVPDDLFM